MTKDRVVIRSGNPGGHHPNYAKLLTEALVARGAAVHVLVPGYEDSGQWRAVQELGATISPLPLTGYRPAQARAHEKAILEALAPPPLAFADQYVDNRLVYSHLSGSHKRMRQTTAHLWMMPQFHIRHGESPALRAKYRVKERVTLGWLAKQKPGSVLVIDPVFAGYVKDGRPELFDRLRYCGDPISMADVSEDEVAAWGEKLRPEPSTKLVLAYGAIAKRKRVDVLIEAAAPLIEAGRDIAVVVAGRWYEEMARWRDASTAFKKLVETGRLIVLDRFIEYEEEAALFRCCDAVWAAYGPSFKGMSGLVQLSARAGTPVIVSRGGTLGVLAGKWKLGAVEEGDATPAIERALKGEGFDAKTAAGYAEHHTLAAFQRHWLEALGIGTG